MTSAVVSDPGSISVLQRISSFRAANYSRILAIPLNLYRDSIARRLGFAHRILDLTTLPHRVVLDDERATALQRYAAGLKGYETRLTRLLAISRQSGIQPVLITQPVLYGRGVDGVTGVNLETIAVNELNGKVAWEALEMYNGVMRNVGHRASVLVIDLAATLANDSDNYYDFVHYTNTGAMNVAAAIYKSLCPFLSTTYPQYAHGHCVKERAPSLQELKPTPDGLSTRQSRAASLAPVGA